MDPTALKPGTTIGHYVIESLVAIGGSAAVYQARDPLACRTVAIKLLLADPETRPERGQRLLREARAYTRLVHPQIVTPHSCCTVMSGSVHRTSALTRRVKAW